MEWTDEYVQIVCSLMAEQVGQGNCPNTHLNPLGYNTVSERFYQMTGISLSKTQLKNKWDKLKGDWSCWNKLMRKQTGTGWDSSKGVIVMDSEWWKKARKDIPGCGKFRKKPLQNLEHLSKMFGDILNDEQDHWNPMSDNPIIPPSQEIFVDADNVVGIGEEEVHDIPDDIGNVVGGEEDEVHEVSPCIANAKKYLVFFLKKIRSQSQAQHLLSKIKSQR
nr:L10-interacting MYB domain-containing protein-like [Aegilops tauschii subsp. strangulata]